MFDDKKSIKPDITLTDIHRDILAVIENKSKVLYYVLKASNLQELQTGGAMPGINRQDVYKQKIPIPHIEKQQEIVTSLDKEMEALEGVRLLRQAAERRIEKIIAEVWGEE